MPVGPVAVGLILVFVEDGSQAMVAAEDNYQALAEEEGHQAAASEDVC